MRATKLVSAIVAALAAVACGPDWVERDLDAVVVEPAVISTTSTPAGLLSRGHSKTQCRVVLAFNNTQRAFASSGVNNIDSIVSTPFEICAALTTRGQQAVVRRYIQPESWMSPERIVADDLILAKPVS